MSESFEDMTRRLRESGVLKSKEKPARSARLWELVTDKRKDVPSKMKKRKRHIPTKAGHRIMLCGIHMTRQRDTQFYRCATVPENVCQQCLELLNW